MPEAGVWKLLNPRPVLRALLFLSRDSLRVFSSLCQIFSEEDNYSQSRELLMQVRAILLSPASAPGPSSPPPPSSPAPSSPSPLLCHHQEVKLQPPVEPHSKKSPRSGFRGGVSVQWGRERVTLPGEANRQLCLKGRREGLTSPSLPAGCGSVPGNLPEGSRDAGRSLQG